MSRARRALILVLVLVVVAIVVLAFDIAGSWNSLAYFPVTRPAELGPDQVWDLPIDRYLVKSPHWLPGPTIKIPRQVCRPCAATNHAGCAEGSVSFMGMPLPFDCSCGH